VLQYGYTNYKLKIGWYDDAEFPHLGDIETDGMNKDEKIRNQYI
jgi:hypothetical protein